MMRALVTMLKQESRDKTRDQPRLTVLYTVNTHAFAEATEDGSRFGSGDNNSLNTIHSFDQAFGVFWNYFRDSELAQSTVLILTTDHAHFPEPAYIEVAGADYQRWFVDKVPLLILDPTHELPNVYDAGVRSSIDLAPSLLHLLGFPRKRANSFLGTSLFEVRSGENGLAAGAIRPDSYLFEQETLHINLPRMRPPELLDGLSVFIDNLYRLDTTQRIWPADESSAKR
jgi:lipoteichoic acid synthase